MKYICNWAILDCNKKNNRSWLRLRCLEQFFGACAVPVSGTSLSVATKWGSVGLFHGRSTEDRTPEMVGW